MMKKILLVFLLMQTSLFAYAQDKIFSYLPDSFASNAERGTVLADGNIALITESSIYPNFYTVIKIDTSGNIIWQKNISPGGFIRPTALAGMEDSSAVAAFDVPGGGNPLLVKFDKSGNTVFKKHFDITSTGFALSILNIIPEPNNAMRLITSNLQVVLADAGGNTIYTLQAVFPNPVMGSSFNVKKNSSGNYCFSAINVNGSLYHGIFGSFDPSFVMKFCFEFDCGSSNAFDFQEISPAEYYLAGNDQCGTAGSWQPFCMVMDTTGQILWNKTINTGNSGILTTVDIADTSLIALLPGFSNNVLFKLSTTGNIQWVNGVKNYYTSIFTNGNNFYALGSDTTNQSSVLKGSLTGFSTCDTFATNFITGSILFTITNPQVNFVYSPFTLKNDTILQITPGTLYLQDGCINTSVNQSNEIESGISIYSNPGHGIFMMDHTEQVIQVEVFDVYGKLILRNNYSGNQGSREIDLSVFSDGVYIIKVMLNKNRVIFKKVVKTG